VRAAIGTLHALRRTRFAGRRQDAGSEQIHEDMSLKNKPVKTPGTIEIKT
jgi:hypothetical protein